ncbi:MAG: hypothetical protein DWQ07_24885 [Chloroflexi bacterium]|nr:MAG: hypothetical protein DWQ07_24885 [Chloroflexota bacterium]MBL1197071.1 hypothetical protein [Chloroflexota bacterium]NOH14366.1 hypothetical protein [Chloroflexota bacterium]
MKKLIATLLLLSIVLVACAAPADPAEPVFEPVEENVEAPPTAELEAAAGVEEEPQSEEAPAEEEVPTEPVVEEVPVEMDFETFAWPVTPPSSDQIVEAKVCDLANLPRNRYAGEFTLDELRGVYEPVIACDWVVLALAYVERLEEDQALPQEAINAYLEGIRLNPALALRTQVFYAYFGTVNGLVDAPPTFAQNIVAIELQYDWNGLGNPAAYQVSITDANTTPVVTGEISGGEPLLQSGEGDAADPPPETPVLPTTVDPGAVQALVLTLTDFWPVAQRFNVFACNDNFPDWSLTLTFEDGSTLELVTEGSNFLPAGGPWQVEIDGQAYVQLSESFSNAMNDLMVALGLPLGQPLSMSCFPDEAIFDYAYNTLE